MGEQTALGNLGSALRDAGQFDEAIEHHQKYLLNAPGRDDLLGEVIMLRELAIDNFAKGNYAQCKYFGLRGLHILEKRRFSLEHPDDQLKIGHRERNEAQIFNILQIALIKLDQHKEALLVSELSRARAVLDLIKEKKPSIQSFTINTLNLISGDSESVLGLDRLYVEQKCNELKEIAKILMASIIVYSITEEPFFQQCQSKKWLYMWVVKENEIFFSKKIISSTADFTSNFEEDYVSTLRRDIGLKKKVDNISEANDADKEESMISSKPIKSSLVDPYQYLIESIENHLNTQTRLVIIPFGFLYLVPFASLKNSKNQFLIENFVISYAQSISILSLLINSSKSLNLQMHSDPLIIGNPTMPSPGIDQLSGAEEEAQCIKIIMGGLVMLGKNATKGKVCRAIMGRSIVHFATHALLGDSVDEHMEAVEEDQVRITEIKGDYSIKGAIVLAKSNNLCSGILTSSEVQGLDLSACQLLTLSCCRTACGKVSGDGVLGLSRALLVAGASCIVNTLWAINDNATACLMKTFYAEYKETNDAALALRAAMLKQISDGYKPDQWSAFRVTGVTCGMVDK